MLRLTLKSVVAKKLRYALTALAVVLGVAFLSGTLVLTDTIRKIFDDLFADVNEGIDVVVRGPKVFDNPFGGGPAIRANVPATVEGELREVPGVAAAEGQVQINYAQLVDADGKGIGNPSQGAPTFGFNWNTVEQLNPFRLVDGRPPEAADEIVIDKGSAKEGGFAVGDKVSVISQAGNSKYEIVGIGKFGESDSPAGASVVLYSTAEAQRVANLPDEYTQVAAVAERGVSQDELADRVRAAFEGQKVNVITGSELTEENQSDFEESISFFNIALYVFAGIALFVGIFIIYNSFQIIVTQRLREMALLRAIGASGGQITGSVIGESIVVGVVASVLGFFLGILLANGLKALLNGLGLDLPSGGTVITPLTVTLSLGVGILLTALSAVIPARRAARVAPIEALSAAAAERHGTWAKRLAWSGGLGALGLGAIYVGLTRDVDVWILNSLLVLGLGILVLFVAVITFAPVIARPVSRVLGAPIRRLRGAPGALAQENAMRSPKRTARTAAALMIGVALVGFITIFGASAKASIGEAIETAVRADYIVSPGGFIGAGVGFPPELSREIAQAPGAADVSGVRFDLVKVDDKDEFVVAIEPQTANVLIDVDTQAGDLADLGDDGVALHEDIAKRLRVGVGDEATLTFLSGTPEPFRVVAVYADQNWGNVMVSQAAAAANSPNRLDSQIWVKLAPGADQSAFQDAVEKLLKPYPTAKLQDQQQFRAEREAQVDQFVNLIYVMLFLAVVIAVIGIVNTLALSIFERTRELGLLRAVGMTRSQVRTSVRWESVIIALFGTVVGLLIGLFFGYVIWLALRSEGFTTFSAAPGQLLVVVVLAIAVGIGAAILPARRASRLDVLEAIATE